MEISFFSCWVRLEGRDNVFWILCSLVNILGNQEASMNTGGIKDHLSSGSISETSARLDAEACALEAHFLRQLHTSSVLWNVCPAEPRGRGLVNPGLP